MNIRIGIYKGKDTALIPESSKQSIFPTTHPKQDQHTSTSCLTPNQYTFHNQSSKAKHIHQNHPLETTAHIHIHIPTHHQNVRRPHPRLPLLSPLHRTQPLRIPPQPLHHSHLLCRRHIKQPSQQHRISKGQCSQALQPQLDQGTGTEGLMSWFGVERGYALVLRYSG